MPFISKVNHPISVESTVLLGVDLQRAWGAESPRPVPGAEAAAMKFAKAAKRWRGRGGNVMHALTIYDDRHRPEPAMNEFFDDDLAWLEDGSPWVEPHEGVLDNKDAVVLKSGFDATATSDLLDRLEERGVEVVVVGGLTTAICVQSTVDGLYRAGLKVVVLHDACASGPLGPMSPDEAHAAAIHRLAHAFADVRSVREFLAGT